MIDIANNFLNALLNEKLIELPHIIDFKFLNGMLSNFHYEEFYNYHMILGHFTQNDSALYNIIQDFIDQGIIKIGGNQTTHVEPVHLDNQKLGVFNNLFPSSQS